MPAGPLYDLAEVFEDAQVRHLGMRVSVPHPTKGTIDLVANGVRLSATPSALKSAAPLLGQHTDEVLADIDSANRET